jgi:hypothetical protein
MKALGNKKIKFNNTGKVIREVLTSFIFACVSIPVDTHDLPSISGRIEYEY